LGFIFHPWFPLAVPLFSFVNLCLGLLFASDGPAEISRALPGQTPSKMGADVALKPVNTSQH